MQTKMDKEICICAAIRYNDDVVVVGARHAFIISSMAITFLIPTKQNTEQGFLTNKGRFVSREEGRALQDAAGIPSASKHGYFPNTLYSEDLY